MLDSALNKPIHLFVYGKRDLFELAAAYGFGIIANHPFIDGNKRTGFLAAVVFLERNGYRFHANEAAAAVETLALAAGETSETAYAAWLKANASRINARKFASTAEYSVPSTRSSSSSETATSGSSPRR